MRRPTLITAALAATLAVTACGDDDDVGEGAAAARAPADAAQISARCGLGAPHSGQPPASLVPEGLLLRGAFVSRWEGDDRGTVVYRGRLNTVYDALLAEARRQELEVEFNEVEVLDAEVEVRDGDGVVRFALSPAPKCPDVTRAVVTRASG